MCSNKDFSSVHWNRRIKTTAGVSQITDKRNIIGAFQPKGPAASFSPVEPNPGVFTPPLMFVWVGLDAVWQLWCQPNKGTSVRLEEEVSHRLLGTCGADHQSSELHLHWNAVSLFLIWQLKEKSASGRTRSDQGQKQLLGILSENSFS